MKQDEHETIETNEFNTNQEPGTGINSESSERREESDEVKPDRGNPASADGEPSRGDEPEGASEGRFDGDKGTTDKLGDGELAEQTIVSIMEHTERESVATYTDASQVSSETAQTVVEAIATGEERKVSAESDKTLRPEDPAEQHGEGTNLISMSRSDFDRRLQEAYDRGRNEAIEARFRTDSHTILPPGHNDNVPFLTVRKSVWENR